MNDLQDERARQAFDFKAAVYASLAAGAVFLLFARGHPWASLGLPTHLMGRPLFVDASAGSFLITAVLHLAVSLVYGLAVAWSVFRLRTFSAIFAAAGVALFLYGLNYLAFHIVFTGVPPATESTVLVTHVAFCMIAAGAYKGFSVPRPTAEMGAR